jgi:hypothetical protein
LPETAAVAAEGDAAALDAAAVDGAALAAAALGATDVVPEAVVEVLAAGEALPAGVHARRAADTP